MCRWTSNIGRVSITLFKLTFIVYFLFFIVLAKIFVPTFRFIAHPNFVTKLGVLSFAIFKDGPSGSRNQTNDRLKKLLYLILIQIIKKFIKNNLF